MTHPSRLAYIASFFVAHYSGTDVRVEFVAAADWYLYLETFPQARYGWTYPCLAEGGDQRYILVVSSEIIGSQTVSLPNGEFRQYLDAIVWMCDRYKDHREHAGFGEIDRDEFDQIQAAIESELYDLSPPALSVFSRVQLSVLDA